MVEAKEEKVEGVKSAVAVGSTMKTYYKYFDATYMRDYFFDGETQESIWDLPKDVPEESYKIIDCTEKEQTKKEDLKNKVGEALAGETE